MTGNEGRDMLTLLVAQAHEDGSDLVTLRALIEEACDLGTAHALERLGVADTGARDDVRELRELLRGWRDAKRSARNAVLGWIVRMLAALLLLGLAVRFDLLRMVRG
jgi:hypothetical protein